jgi:hypothetical protein
VPSGEAITHKIMSPELVRILFLVVALSMALTPFLAEAGAKLSKAFDKGDMKVTAAHDLPLERLKAQSGRSRLFEWSKGRPETTRLPSH